MVEGLISSQERLAQFLHTSGAFKTGDFKLKLHETNPDAPLSPYYISMREQDVYLHCYQPLVRVVAKALDVNTRNLGGQVDYVVGIPKAGNSIAKFYSEITGLPQLTMEKDETDSGRRISSKIHGDFEPGQRVLGVDDLITAADTKFEFKKGLEANGLVLAHLAVAVDREQGGIRKLQEAGISVSAALTVTQMLEFYLRKAVIDQSTFDRITAYLTGHK